ncbi:nitrous oxide reductase family maturation protein NosD [Occultella aeris]|uniref:Pectate lyase superfamily protein n=1 Tax=Occultella aeris TaxID=2761496 RepID=A0A7M4DFI9_9MICO|nr:right-handed parallel beta-helix repeat-containing protein [Occultella aeris]VZO35682.1 Pectate lyase superfamily protein [Occultella aeris]
MTDRDATRSSRRAILIGAGALGLAGLAVPARAEPDPPRHPRTVIADDLIVKGPVPWVDVRAYGAIGDGTTDDTDAIRSAVAALPPSGGTLLWSAGSYSVSGSIVFDGFTDLTVRGAGGVAITQVQELTKTFEFRSCTGLSVRDLTFVGCGTEHSNEPTATSFNGVAAIFLFDVTGVLIEHCTVRNHAGGGLRWSGALESAWFVENTFVGIGVPSIEPLANNSDFAIGGFAATRNVDITITGNDISASCFGIGVSGGDRVVISGNRIHDIPGQHGIYLSATSRVTVTDNVITRTYGLGIKNQVAESYPGDVSEVDVSHNLLVENQTAIVIATTSGVAQSRHLTNVSIVGNIIRGARESGIYHTAGVDSRIADNHIDDTGNYGIYLRFVSGDITDNSIRRTGWTGLWAQVDELTTIRGNVFVDNAIAPRTQPGDLGRTEWSHHVYLGTPAEPRTPEPVAVLTDNVHSAPSGEPDTLTALVRISSPVTTVWSDNINLTAAPLRVDGTIRHSDTRYSPQASIGAETRGDSVVSGRGHREFHAAASPETLPASSLYAVGDICWRTDPAADGPLAWICITAGQPGTWRALS